MAWQPMGTGTDTLLTQLVAELGGVDDGRAGLASNIEDLVAERGVEGRVGLRVVGWAANKGT